MSNTELRVLLEDSASHMRATVALFQTLPAFMVAAHLGITARRLAGELERAAIELQTGVTP